jgi:hypothetical protein
MNLSTRSTRSEGLEAVRAVVDVGQVPQHSNRSIANRGPPDPDLYVPQKHHDADRPVEGNK